MILLPGAMLWFASVAYSGGPWIPDNGDGTYTNPVIYADYSDPDVIRVGDDFYLTSSSFSHFPGLPILHSRDCVNWRIIGHALPAYPDSSFLIPQHGMAVWAPAIRFHNSEFYIYFGDPDRGVFMTKARNPAGPWEPLRLIRKVTGWIDTCPFWDDDGNAYLVHAWANSRAGIKSILAVNRMNAEGTTIFDDGVIVFDGHQHHPTMEGPKLYKRNAYYYVFAPAGGVKPGWQTVLRSRNILGPYEDRVVLEQGSTRVNGPHQGAWVTTPSGQDWFLHFQDRYAYGRIVHLEPMRWENDWPVIGVDADGNGIGEPVGRHAKPDVGRLTVPSIPQTSDECDTGDPGLQWQWQANPSADWSSRSARDGWLRLYAQRLPAGAANLWSAAALMLQKFPAPAFTVTTRIDPSGSVAGDRSGLMVFGLDYAYVGVEKTRGGIRIVRVACHDADKGTKEKTIQGGDIGDGVVYLRVSVHPESDTTIVPTVLCTFAYSTDGKTYVQLGDPFVAREGRWVGAKVGLFNCAGTTERRKGFVDVDWFRVE